MKEIHVTENDLIEFIDTKIDSSYAIAEIYTYKYLRTIFNDKAIFKGKNFDFVIYGDIKWKPLLVEVKYNHLKLSIEQLYEYYYNYYPKYRLWIISNKNKGKRSHITIMWYRYYIKRIDQFKTPLGNFYCYEVYKIELRNYG